MVHSRGVHRCPRRGRLREAINVPSRLVGCVFLSPKPIPDQPSSADTEGGGRKYHPTYPRSPAKHSTRVYSFLRVLLGEARTTPRANPLQIAFDELHHAAAATCNLKIQAFGA